jgi:hypothetical protein
MRQCCYQAKLSHKSAATAVCCRILQRPANVRAFADVNSAHSRVGRHHIRELVGDFSNALDLCDSLRRNQQRRPLGSNGTMDRVLLPESVGCPRSVVGLPSADP